VWLRGFPPTIALDPGILGADAILTPAGVSRPGFLRGAQVIVALEGPVLRALIKVFIDGFIVEAPPDRTIHRLVIFSPVVVLPVVEHGITGPGLRPG